MRWMSHCLIRREIEKNDKCWLNVKNKINIIRNVIIHLMREKKKKYW